MNENTKKRLESKSICDGVLLCEIEPRQDSDGTAA